MKRKIAFLMIIALMTSVFVTACAPGGDGSGTQNTPADSGSTTDGGAQTAEPVDFTVAIAYENTTLDPHTCNGTWDAFVTQNIHDPLVRLNPDGTIRPCLATEWTISDDGLEYTFKLAEGVKFHDGTPLKASDVKWSIERAMQQPASARFTAPFDHVEVIDESTVKLVLKYVCVATLNYLAQANNCIVSEEIMNRVGEDAYKHAPIGSGPFVFQEWIPGDRINFTGNDEYFLGAPDIDNLAIRTMTDSTSAYFALETGDIDAMLGVPTMNVADVANNDKLVLKETGGAAFWYIAINCKLAPFDNVKFRQALSYAVDRQEIIDIALDGQGVVADFGAMPISMGYVDSVKRYDVDLEKAKTLLAEAGYVEGTVINIYCREDFTTKVAQVIQQQLSRIGVTAEVVVMERSALIADNEAGKLGMSTFGSNDLVYDATIPLSALDSNYIPATNMCNYSNPEYDALNAQQASERDPQKRAEIIAKMLEIEREDCPRIALFNQTVNIAYSNEFTGVEAVPNQQYFLYNFKLAN